MCFIKNNFFLYKNIDELTQLKNREYLISRLNNDFKYNIIIVDIDSFDEVNVIHGYDIGNIVLQQYSGFLSNIISTKYDIYRLYSDKFALVYKENKSKKEYIHDIQNIINLTRKCKFYDNQVKINICLEVSIGAAIDCLNALQKANIALKKTKKENKQFSFYHDKMTVYENTHNFSFTKLRIKKAILENRIEAFYQPIYNKNRDVVKYETLMRIIEDDTIILPGNFLKVAVKSKQYSKLSYQVINKAVRCFKNTKNKFSINIGFLDIIDKNIICLLDETFSKNKNIAHRVTFELLECDKIKDYNVLYNFIQKYRSIGVKFAIDDFGTGYSNFSKILSLKPDFIKIDGSLIQNIHKENSSYELVKFIVSFSKTLGIKLVAEYVHCKEVFEILCELNIDEFQGFYLSKPLINI
jgi:diguanylate cyclase (GGDEF)-like protein